MLILIKSREKVGQTLNDADVYRIGRIVFLPLSMKHVPPDFELNVSCYTIPYFPMWCTRRFLLIAKSGVQIFTT